MEEALTPLGIAGHGGWLVSRCERTVVKCVNIGNVEDYPPPRGPAPLGRLGDEVEIARPCSKAGRTGQADFPHPALGQDFTLSRATPSAASEQFSELIGCPISASFTTYCVCLELRSLPSTGVTRLPRYYEPLRHPRAPSLSLTGFRLVIADHALGLPVFRALSLCTCRRHYPGAASERIASLIFIQTYQSSPIGLSGRPAHCPFRGLLGVHSRCGLHTRAVTNL